MNENISSPLIKSNRKKQLARVLILIAAVMLLSMIITTPVFATASAPPTGTVNTTNMISGINKFSAALKGFGVPIAVLMMIISGIALMSGQQGRQWAKSTMLWTGIGLGVVLMSATLVDALKASFS